MSSTSTIPVLLLVGKDSAQTRAAVEALGVYKPKLLFVAADHPNLRRTGEAERYQGARNQLELIKWPCEINGFFSPVHRGRAVFIEQAVSWFFEKNSEGIIIEDCCAPTPDFFRFAEQALIAYRSVPAVQQIGGSSLVPSRKRSASYYFSKYSQLFAWATWKRVWDGFQASRETPSAAVISRACPDPDEATLWTQALNADRPPSFEAKWNYYIWSTNGLCVTPAVNLVRHLDNRAGFENFPVNKLRSLPVDRLGEISHPEAMVRDDETDHIVYLEFYSRTAHDINTPETEPAETLQIELTEEIPPPAEEHGAPTASVDVSGLFERAQALRRMARIEEAIFTLEFLLSAAPSHTQAEALLNDLKQRQAEHAPLDAPEKPQSQRAADQAAEPVQSPPAPPEAISFATEPSQSAAAPEPIASKVNGLIDFALDSMEREDNDGALQFISEALEVNFVVRDLQHVFAMCLIKFNRLSEAKEALDAELKRYPDNRAAADLLAQVSDALAEEEQARKTKEEAERAKIAAEEEKRRIEAQAEEQRRAAEAEEKRREAEAEEERTRIAEEQKRLQAEEDKRRAAEEERKKAAEQSTPAPSRRPPSIIALPPELPPGPAPVERATTITLPAGPPPTIELPANTITGTTPGPEAVAAVNALIDEAIEALMHSDGEKALALMAQAESKQLPVRDLFHVKGLSLIQLGMEQEAKAALETELKLYPDNRSAEELLTQLVSQLKS